MNKQFFIGNLEFFNSNILIQESRPFTNLKEMHQQLIHNWNETVSDNDTVWILGKFTMTWNFQDLSQLVHQLKGHKKILLDHAWLPLSQYYAAGFEFVTIYPVLIEESFLLSYEAPSIINTTSSCYYIFGYNNLNIDITINNYKCVDCTLNDYRPVPIDLH